MERKAIVRIANPPPDVESNRTWVGPWLYIFQHDVFAETLLGNDEITGEAFGLLAESWETNDDFTQWSFKLREGIPFQHGWGDVTTADVEHTFKQLIRDDSLASLRSVWEEVTLDIQDDHNIAFNFGVPYLDGTKLFSRHAGDLIIVSDAQFQAEGLDAFDSNLTAGTGPYQVTDRELGVSLSYERVPEGHHSYDVDFDNFEFVWAAESLTRMAMLLSDEVHISAVERTLQPDAEARGMRIIPSTLPSQQTALMFGGLYFQNTERFPDHYQPGLPFESFNVRKALNLAIDRDAVLDEIYLGRATPVHRFVFNPLNEGWNPEWVERFDEAYRYDPDEARALLAQEGYGPDNPLKIRSSTTVIPGSPELHDVTEAIQIMFAEVDVEMSITKIDFGEWLNQLRGHVWQNQLIATRNTPIRTTQLGTHTFIADTGNWWGYADDFVNERNQCLINESDIAVRHECALSLGNYLYDNYSDIPMFEISHTMAVNPEFIEGWVYPGLSSAGITHFHNIKAVK
jgi:ABC-type transport system substrate-binding protein